MQSSRSQKGSGFIGTYTRKEGHVDGKAMGFYKVMVDKNTGILNIGQGIGEVVNPSYLAYSDDGRNLYVAEEDNPGRVIAYALDNTGNLLELNRLDTGSAATCHIATSRNDKFVVASNYVEGKINIYRKDDYGGLIQHQRIEFQPKDGSGNSHAHSAVFTKDDQFLFVPDIGLDRIWMLRFDKDSNKYRYNSPAFVEVPKGNGPRHFCFHPRQRHAYVVNEYSNSVNHFSFNKKSGLLTAVSEASTLPAGFTGDSYCADIHSHPNGQFLYASNRGHDSIAIFSIGNGGRLKLLKCVSTEGEYPRGFVLSKNGRHLYAANQNTNSIVQYSVNKDSGMISKVAMLEVATPVCIALGE